MPENGESVPFARAEPTAVRFSKSGSNGSISCTLSSLWPWEVLALLIPGRPECRPEPDSCGSRLGKESYKV